MINSICSILLSLFALILLIPVAYKTIYRYFIRKRLNNNRKSAYKGLRVVVTGASSGIGEELVKRYAEGGAKLVIVARRTEELERVKKICEAKYGNDQIDICGADVSVMEDCKRMVEESLRYLDGRIDILVLNAGLGALQRFNDVQSLHDHRRLMEVNYWGCVYSTFYALPYLKKQKNGAKIVVVSSIAGRTGTMFRTAYAPTKHALHGFYDSLRLELLEEGFKRVQIQLICPGFVKTALHVNAIGSSKDTLKRDLSRFMSVEDCVDKMLVAIEEGHFISFLDKTGMMTNYIAPFLPQFIYDKIRINVTLKAANTDKKNE
jgi:short-subunit dehydrogenase